MRRLSLRRNRRPVVKLPGHRDLRRHVYQFEGQRYVLQQASWSTDGDMQLSLVDEATFVERNAMREQRRSLAELLRRHRKADADA